MTDCEKWLSETIKPGTFMNCEDVRKAATEKGFSKGQLTTARKALKLVPFNDYASEKSKVSFFWARIDSGGFEDGQ